MTCPRSQTQRTNSYLSNLNLLSKVNLSTHMKTYWTKLNSWLVWVWENKKKENKKPQNKVQANSKPEKRIWNKKKQQRSNLESVKVVLPQSHQSTWDHPMPMFVIWRCNYKGLLQLQESIEYIYHTRKRIPQLRRDHGNNNTSTAKFWVIPSRLIDASICKLYSPVIYLPPCLVILLINFSFISLCQYACVIF